MRSINWLLGCILIGAAGGFVSPAFADDADDESAMEQLEQANEDGQEAVEAPTEEEAYEEAGETFDTPHDSDGD